MVVTMLNRGSKHLFLSLSLLKTINAMEDWEGKGSVFLPLTPPPLELWVFFLFIICLNPEFLHITTCKGVFYQSLEPPPPSLSSMPRSTPLDGHWKTFRDS